MRGSDLLEVSDDASVDLAGFWILFGGVLQSDNGVGCHRHE